LFISRRNQETSPVAFQHFTNPEYVLINGLGRIPGGPQSSLAVVNVRPKLRYRFRLVNIACVAAFNFSIDGHAMTVIETDGTEAVPSKPVDIVTVWVGQRVSVIVEANRKVGNYCE
jgi:iron transport multicopper oxidase